MRPVERSLFLPSFISRAFVRSAIFASLHRAAAVLHQSTPRQSTIIRLPPAAVCTRSARLPRCRAHIIACLLRIAWLVDHWTNASAPQTPCSSLRILTTLSQSLAWSHDRLCHLCVRRPWPSLLRVMWPRHLTAQCPRRPQSSHLSTTTIMPGSLLRDNRKESHSKR
jgi:hypothetical protein